MESARAQAIVDKPWVPRVLVVDDSATARFATCELLQAAGYEVDTANSGEEAYERCLSEPFDLVVSDLTMNGLSGVQLCRLLRTDNATQHLPVILLTANDEAHSRFWARNAGAHAYVAKNNMKHGLLPEIGRVLQDVPPRRDGREPLARENIHLARRLSQLLDDLLFQAVMASEIRRLVRYADDRDAFVRAFVDLVSEVTDYDFLVVNLGGPGGPSYIVQSRWAYQTPLSSEMMDALRIPEQATPHLQTLFGRTAPGTLTLDQLSEPSSLDIAVENETFGFMRVFCGRRSLGTRDKTILELIAREVGLVVKSLFLMEETHSIAYTDALTGLANRRHVGERLQIELDRVQRYGGAMSVVICDIDHFKQINDRFGHNVGDVVLQRVARTLCEAVRKVDLIGRWGGEEFLVVLSNTGETGSRVVAERLRSAVEKMNATPDGPDRVTISLGVAAHQPDMTMTVLLERADQALYKAKQRGRNRVEVAYAQELAPPPR